jgi:hypothetical protein
MGFAGAVLLVAVIEWELDPQAPMATTAILRLMIVTSDDRHHVAAPSPAAMTAFVALAQADTVLVCDPADRRLIAANVRGTMPWTEDPATPGT